MALYIGRTKVKLNLGSPKGATAASSYTLHIGKPTPILLDGIKLLLADGRLVKDYNNSYITVKKEITNGE